MTARVASTPFARKLARIAGVALAQIRGSGPGGRVVAADLSRHTLPLRPDPHPNPLPLAGVGWGEGGAATQARRIASTPLARRLARTRSVDLARIRGSGPNGRIVARDLDRSLVLTVTVATRAASELCAHLNRTLPRDAPPITVADVVTMAVARVTGGDIAWTVDGIRTAWAIAAAARQGLAAIARARMAGAQTQAPSTPLLRAVVSGGRVTLTIAFPSGEIHPPGLAARIRDTIAWPIGLLL